MAINQIKNSKDLSDVTFLTLIRLDSIDRLENILAVTEFLVTHFETNIVIMEVSTYNNRILSSLLPENVQHYFVEDYDPIFHRTHYLNEIVKKANTPIISLWDSDVLVDKDQIEESVSIIRSGKADFVLPYDRFFLDTSTLVREQFMKRKNFQDLKDNKNKMKPLYIKDPVGGAVFSLKENYVAAGMENKRFYGWGNHDGERINRWEILGYRVRRVMGPMYHLTHSRTVNSKYHSTRQSEIKRVELERLAMMSKGEMQREISQWKHYIT